MLTGSVASQPRGRRLVPRQSRRLAAGVILLGAALLTALAVEYAGSSSAGRIDRAIDDRLIAHFGQYARLVRALADLGSPEPVFASSLLLVLALAVLRRPRGALLAAFAPIIASATTEWVLKPLVDRTQGGALSFPSGRATGFCTVAAVVVLLVLDQTPPRLRLRFQMIVCLAAVGLACCVTAAVVAARDHYATDTVGGACVALVTVLTLGLAIDGLADRRMLP